MYEDTIDFNNEYIQNLLVQYQEDNEDNEYTQQYTDEIEPEEEDENDTFSIFNQDEFYGEKIIQSLLGDFDEPLPKMAYGGPVRPRSSQMSSDALSVSRPINPLSIPKILPEVTVRGQKNNNPFEAAGAKIGYEYVDRLKKDPRYKKSPWSVGSPTDVIDPLINYPGQILDQATGTAQNQILKPSSVVDATTLAEEFPYLGASIAGGMLYKAIGRQIADPVLEKGLRQSTRLAKKEGWTAEQLAKHQFENYGITENQRKAYIPGISDLLSNHIIPFGYEGKNNFVSKAQMVRHKERNPQLGNRFNAWNMYLGKPQQDIPHPDIDGKISKTFSYLGNENGEDILQYNNYQPAFINRMQRDKLRNNKAILETDTGGIMGSYGLHPIGEDNIQYRDRWDLHFPINHETLSENSPQPIAKLLQKAGKAYPNLFFKDLDNPEGIYKQKTINFPVESIIGKPFHSRGNLKLNDQNPMQPYLTTNYKYGGKYKIKY